MQSIVVKARSCTRRAHLARGTGWLRGLRRPRALPLQSAGLIVAVVRLPCNIARATSNDLNSGQDGCRSGHHGRDRTIFPAPPTDIHGQPRLLGPARRRERICLGAAACIRERLDGTCHGASISWPLERHDVPQTLLRRSANCLIRRGRGCRQSRRLFPNPHYGRTLDIALEQRSFALTRVSSPIRRRRYPLSVPDRQGFLVVNRASAATTLASVTR